MKRYLIKAPAKRQRIPGLVSYSEASFTSVKDLLRYAEAHFKHTSDETVQITDHTSGYKFTLAKLKELEA